MNVYTAVCQKWEESEQGWGTRPDGYSLHLTDAHREQYIKDYWDRMPEAVPCEYTRPCGRPKVKEIDAETYQKLVNNNGNLRY